MKLFGARGPPWITPNCIIPCMVVVIQLRPIKYKPQAFLTETNDERQPACKRKLKHASIFQNVFIAISGQPQLSTSNLSSTCKTNFVTKQNFVICLVGLNSPTEVKNSHAFSSKACILSNQHMVKATKPTHSLSNLSQDSCRKRYVLAQKL